MEKLLFEIGTEEIPAKFMPGILKQLQELAAGKMQELRIPFENITVYGTPRRMTFIAAGVAETQADSTIEAKGPSVKIAFVSGAPSKAAIGFARGQGIDVKDLEVRGEYVYAVKHLAGQPVADLLPGLLLDILESLSFPKNMRWADYDFRFVRPIRWLVALFGEKVIPVEITGVKSGRYSMGHRFMQQSMKEAVETKGLLSAAINKVGNVVHSAVMGMQGAVEIPNADAYVQALADNFVMVDQDARRELIRQQVTELAAAEGGIAEIDEDLLEEVNYLVEYPTALCGKFEEKFLSLPKEAIITPMREHQRYFPVVDEEGRLLNKFITVRNGGKEFLDVVAHGNERVLRARLSDAEFFFNEDRKKPLIDRQDGLTKIVFQEGLGNLADKTERLLKLGRVFGEECGLHEEAAVVLERATELAKTDLTTGMVTEFTELQGVMGKEYALLDGESPEVAEAIFEQYLPRFAGDVLPQTEAGKVLSIIDKVDNIVATFSRGLIPTGSQDPYALRRQTIGILNILLGSEWNISLRPIFKASMELLNVATDKQEELLNALLGEQLAWALEDRMEISHQLQILRDSQGGKYTPFISSEVNKTLKLKLESSTSLQSIIRNLTGGNTTNIFNQFNQQNNLNTENTISIEEARTIVLESQKVLTKTEEAKLLEDKYDINSLPEVVATKQEGVDTSKEGLNLNKKELNQITDNYKAAMELSSKEHHELRREIEMRIDTDSYDPEMDRYLEDDEILESEEDTSLAASFLNKRK